jgi:hypothetical protein
MKDATQAEDKFLGKIANQLNTEVKNYYKLRTKRI